MANRFIECLKRRTKRIIEKNVYYKQTLKEIKGKYNSKKNNIWFIGSAHYDNIGDLAISEATINFLTKNFKNCNIIEIRLCDYYKYVKAIKKVINDEDIIIMQGGGNMGFAYFDAENNRREVIKKFKKNKIVIFPSTIDYGNSLRERIEYKKSIKIYNKHSKLYICAREKKSYNLMKKIYKNVILVPDIVLSFNNINLNPERRNIIVCLRNDKEKTNSSIDLLNYFKNNKECIFTDNVAKETNISVELRKKIFWDKLKELSKGKIVITDRLHVMIFCTLIKVPCLFTDNSNGKLSGVYELWIKEKCNYIKKINFDQNIEEQVNHLSNIKINCKVNFQEDFNDLIDIIEK